MERRCKMSVSLTTMMMSLLFRMTRFIQFVFQARQLLASFCIGCQPGTETPRQVGHALCARRPEHFC
jgi:hypothetical protein